MGHFNILLLLLLLLLLLYHTNATEIYTQNGALVRFPGKRTFLFIISSATAQWLTLPSTSMRTGECFAKYKASRSEKPTIHLYLREY
jgi:hypothetical protein